MMQTVDLIRVVSPTQLIVRLSTDAVVRVTLSDALTPGQRASAGQMMVSTMDPAQVELELWGYDLGTMAFSGRNLQIPEALGAIRAPYAKRARCSPGRQE